MIAADGPENIHFCQQVWSMLADGGMWGVPRSGLVYRKDAAHKRLTLTSRMPWEAEMPGTPALLRSQQDGDHEGIRTGFDAIGVEVTDETA